MNTPVDQAIDVKTRLYTIIFGHNTPAGKLFDLVLIYTILFSVLIVILDSVEVISGNYGWFFRITEWVLTIFFTIEYGVRIYCSPNRWRYIFSYYGIVDLLAIIPSYLSLFMTGMSYLLIIRLLRVLRIFRILKLVQYLRDANVLMRSLAMARRKIFIFFTFVVVLATIFGSLMFVIEGPGNGFTSIPKSIYWTIVTITTVGYGDITPITTLGQMIAALVMLTGYSIIAVPTGIFTAEIAQEMQRQRHHVCCQNCERTDHENDAGYCRHCGVELPEAK
ncbi:MAG: voltage-gated potassium channel [Cellvibrionaceae bacterium]|jgi:voltage-gated potassium channel